MNKLQIFYIISYDYLIKILPDNIDENLLQKYFAGDAKDYKSLSDIFEQFISSTQNYNRMPNVIKYKERKEEILNTLFRYDIDKVKQLDVDTLFRTFFNKYNSKGEYSKYNSWYKWSKPIIDSAKFLSEFSDINNFKEFINLFSYNIHTRIALPLLLEKRISGMGFALACDCLKELGYYNYSKPDVHIKEVLYKTGLCENNDISAFETIDRISNECKCIDNSMTPYKVDKILWLICSGKFYKDNIKIELHKTDLIKTLNTKLD